MKKIITSSLFLFLFGLGLLKYWILPQQAKLSLYRFTYQENRVIKALDPTIPFKQYVKNTKEKIKTALQPLYLSSLTNASFIGDYNLEQVVDFRSPEEISPNRLVTSIPPCNQTKQLGFLFLHALTDTPYSGKTLRSDLQKSFPCATYRAVLLPGHGTVPGDSLHTDFKEWVVTTKYGIEAFFKNEYTEQLFIIGYSTGFTLAIHYLQSPPTHRRQLAGIIGLSPGLKAKDPFAPITPWIPRSWLPFLNFYPDTNPMKYESFSLNFALQFYRLTQSINRRTIHRGVSTPLFMGLSSDDETADPLVNLDFFCNSTKLRKNLKRKNLNRMIWYQGYQIPPNFKSNQEVSCKSHSINNINNKNITVRPSHYPEYHHSNFSHSSIVFPPYQPFYGHLKPHHDCRTYYGTTNFTNCSNYNHTIIYGENNLLEKLNSTQIANAYYQRSTFNPDYSYLLTEIVSFIKKVIAE